MAKTRTFIGIAADKEVRQQAEQFADALGRVTTDIRFVEPENLHFTLHFLGDLSDHELADVCMRVKRTVAELAPFEIDAVGSGAFPNQERPRVFWIGVDRGADQMTALHAEIGTTLDGLGFRGENRAFVPHLTVGRVGRGPASENTELASVLSSYQDYAAGGMKVASVRIFASEMTQDGPVYQTLATCPLEG